jgi:penicillin-binding protein 1A
MRLSRILLAGAVLLTAGAIGVTAAVFSVSSSLPQMIKVEDYEPLLVTEVFARGGEKIGEYFRENRRLIPFREVPERLIKAFLAAEDSNFFEHGGVNYLAILRAFMVNVSSGEKRQGASTITQQVARALLLSSEKTYIRKIKEIILAHRMEENLSKEEILFLYLNQIYFGEGAYGVVAAAETYFRKPVNALTLAEMSILAGLPQAPSSYSPTEHPQKAKARQKYVLERMSTIGAITPEEKKAALEEPVTVYLNKEYKQVAPYFVETLRQILVQQFGEKAVLDEGLRVYTSIDFKAQQQATIEVMAGLRELDKRQGFRGAAKNLAKPEEQEQFLVEERKKLKTDKAPIRIIKPDGNVVEEGPLTVFHKLSPTGTIVSNIPEYLSKGQIVDAVVTKVDDLLGVVTARFADAQGMIDLADMAWAHKPDPTVNAAYAPKISKPSQAVKIGDVILVKVTGDKFSSPRLLKEVAPNKPAKRGAPTPPVTLPPSLGDPNEYAQLALEQEPLVEGALISFDQRSGEIIAMVGGKEFVRNKNEFNRTIQAKRQTGSSFKTIVYAAALDRGFTPATPIQDAPVVLETKNEDATEPQEGQGDPEDVKIWKPHNHGQKFVGDVLFRTALIRSLNIPAVKVLEGVGVSWAMDYAKRLGIFSPLNQDLTLVLGSSSVTLYEMTKVFSHFGRLGTRIRPIVIHKVVDKDAKVLLESVTLDRRFDKEITEIDTQFEEKRKGYLAQKAAQGSQPSTTASAVVATSPETPPRPRVPQIFFDNPDQLISPQTAYIMTSLLSAVVTEEGGTGGAARALGRPVAGKTGTTNGYNDAWFVGYTPQIATGVWVGYDEEKTLGPGEVGGRAALPIWLEFMKAAHRDLPVLDFERPPGVVVANIDNQTGKLASALSTHVVRQAFIEGSEPKVGGETSSREDETEFLKKDLTD